jgi:hypothetical protein
MPQSGARTLSDVREPTLTSSAKRAVGAGATTWHGSWAEHGVARLTDLLQALADCPKARSASIYDRCKVAYEGLMAG